MQKVVSEMNVQLSNKCQFLPQVRTHLFSDLPLLFMTLQDMVVEFARMNSFQVLEETEKAVSDLITVAMHEKYIIILFYK